MNYAAAFVLLLVLAGCAQAAAPAKPQTVRAALPCSAPTLEVVAFDRVRLCNRPSNFETVVARLRGADDVPHLRVVAGPRASFVDVLVMVRLLYEAGVTDMEWAGREIAI
jgi:hypothetical protein